MLKKKALSRKRRWIIAPVAGVVTAAVVAATLYDSAEVAIAKPSLPGIEEIVGTNGLEKPFTILELVSEPKNARIGFLVDGQEPAAIHQPNGANSEAVMSIDDMASPAERADNTTVHYGIPADATEYAYRFPAFDYLNGSAFTWENYNENPNGKIKRTTYGTFVKNENGTPNGDYKGKDSYSGTYKVVVDSASRVYDSLNPSNNKPDINDVINFSGSSTDKAPTTGVLYQDIVNFEYVSASWTNPNGVDRYELIFEKASSAGYDAPYALDENNGYHSCQEVDLDDDGTNDNSPFFNSQYYIADTELKAVHQEYVPESIDPETGETIPAVPEMYFLEKKLPKDTELYQLQTDGTYKRATAAYFAFNDTFMDASFTRDLEGSPYVLDSSGNPTTELLDDTTGKVKSFAQILFEAQEKGNPLGYVYITEYDSNIEDHASREGDKLYIKEVKGTGNGLYIASDSPKTAVVMDGQEAIPWGVDPDDDMSVHVYFYIPSELASYTYIPGDASGKNGEYDFVQDFGGAKVEEYSYDGLVNDEWFKKYVLDREASECSGVVVDVITKTYDDATIEDIDNADLIYISSENGDTNLVIDDAVAKHIVETVKYNKPIMIDAGNLIGNLNFDPSDPDYANNLPMMKLVISLCQYDLKDSLIDAALKTGGDWDSATVSTPEILKGYYDAAFNTTATNRGNYVNRSVFVSVLDNTISDKFVTKDAVKNVDITFNGNTVNLKPVLDDIEQESRYLKIANVKDADKFNKELSVATIIRYIINYGDKRTISKNKISVLEIEPYYSAAFESDIKNYELSKTLKKEQRDLFDRKWFTTYVTDTVKDDKDHTNLPVKSVGIKEFIGCVEDLNSSYDLIYIGLDKQYLNLGDKSGNKDVIETKYNDSSMNGLVYTHIGDKYSINNVEMGLNGDYRQTGLDLTFEKTRELEEYIEAGYAVIVSNDFFKVDDKGVVVSVNDSMISTDSYMYELGQFILGKSGKVDGSDADEKKHPVYYGQNVLMKSDFEGTGETVANRKDKFATHLSIAKLNIVCNDKPTEYFEGEYDKQNKPIYNYLDMNRNGDYVLEYDIVLENNSEMASSTYDCVLYVDADADGRYEELEALSDVTDIEEKGSGLPAKMSYDSKKDRYYFELETGIEYHISALAEGFVGYVPWKLVFTENGRDNVRSAISGACAINNKEEKPTIHILQITSGNSTETMKKGSGSIRNINNPNNGWVWYGTSLNLLNDEKKNPEMYKLYQEVKDFNIDVTQVSIDEFLFDEKNTYPIINKNSAHDRTVAMINYLHSFDMVVMGFSETYYIPYDKYDQSPTYCGMYAIREYILSGNSMLFSHDLTTNQTAGGNSFTAKDNNGRDTTVDPKEQVGWFANRYLRDVQGMDRFGQIEAGGYLDELSKKAGMGEKYTLPSYDSKYDNSTYNTRINPGADAKEGVTVTRLQRYASSSQKGELGIDFKECGNGSEGTILGVNCNDWNTTLRMNENDGMNGGNNTNSLYIRSINSGQITEYPFHISEDEDVKISNTHGQYFQLNLDTDSRDMNFDDDVVVWYTISNQKTNDHRGYYTANYNDARNNYYIFNKGNITYTGAGHSLIDGDAERRLFVNTLVAAYNAGAHAPRATFKDKADKFAGDVKAVYEPYDIQAENASGTAEGETASNYFNFNFKVVNTNIANTATVINNELVFPYIYAQYYIEVPENTAGAIKVGDYWCKVIPNADQMLTVEKRVDKNGNKLASPVALDNPYVLESNCIYTAQLKTSLLTSNGGTSLYDYGVGDDKKKVLELNKHNYKILVRLKIEQLVTNEGKQGHLSEIPAMNTTEEKLPGTDSISELTVSFTDLYELK